MASALNWNEIQIKISKGKIVYLQNTVLTLCLEIKKNWFVINLVWQLDFSDYQGKTTRESISPLAYKTLFSSPLKILLHFFIPSGNT